MKNKNYYCVGTILKSNIKTLVEKGKIETPNTNTWPFTFLAWSSIKKWQGQTSFMGPNLG